MLFIKDIWNTLYTLNEAFGPVQVSMKVVKLLGLLLTAILPYINLSFFPFSLCLPYFRKSLSFAGDGKNTNNLVIWSGYLQRWAVAVQGFQNLNLFSFFP